MPWITLLIERGSPSNWMPVLLDRHGTAAVGVLPDDLPKVSADEQSVRSGLLQLGWAGGSVRRLTVLRQHSPLRALFPLEADGADAVVVNTSGGVVGGDRLAVEVEVEDATTALVTTQAAEKIYRSAGPEADLRTTLRVSDKATLAWLPQETILFDGCRVRRRLEVAMHASARLLAAEMLVFGRKARGERLAWSDVRESWDVRVDGRLVWAERFGLRAPNGPLFDEPALLGGAGALATIVFAAAEASSALERARAAMVGGCGVRCGVTAVNGLLVGRMLAVEPAACRRALAGTLAAWRGGLLGQPARLPRLWSI